MFNKNMYQQDWANVQFVKHKHAFILAIKLIIIKNLF